MPPDEEYLGFPIMDRHEVIASHYDIRTVNMGSGKSGGGVTITYMPTVCMWGEGGAIMGKIRISN